MDSCISASNNTCKLNENGILHAPPKVLGESLEKRTSNKQGLFSLSLPHLLEAFFLFFSHLLKEHHATPITKPPLTFLSLHTR